MTRNETIERLERAQFILQKTVGKSPQSTMGRELQEGRIAIAINEITLALSEIEDSPWE